MAVTSQPHTAQPFTLSITERAAKQVLRIVAANQLPENAGLRAAVTKGGCSGFNYHVEIVEGPSSTDVVMQRHGANIFVDQDSLHAINGMTIDWTSSMQESRFVFDNPNATGTCGCGVSFSLGD